jgi:hypothetical protein
VNALLVVGCCLIGAAGTLAVVSVFSRLRFGRLPGAFRCRLGPPSGWRRSRALWRLRRTRAVWLHDVLVIQSGCLRLGMTIVCPTISRGASVVSLGPSEVRGLGRHAVGLALTAEDGRRIVVATSVLDRTALVGPFLTAAVTGLPRAPRDHDV